MRKSNGIVLLLSTLLVACGDGDRTFSRGDGGPRYHGCATAVDCDDHLLCTLDTCNGGVCQHAVGANAGPTACPAQQFCVLLKGCVRGKPCAADRDCDDMDPCTVHERCEPATAICTYSVLDRDGDGHPPVVCGGDDCDDSDSLRFPGNLEQCDGRDNGCTGVVDVGADCASPFLTCQNGRCQCKPENTCGGGGGGGGGTPCIDRDPHNCGACGRSCPMYASCSDGICRCGQGTTECGNTCIDLRHSRDNCGQCGKRCDDGRECSGGVCQCRAGTVDCSGDCIDLQSDPFNCGQCGKACPINHTCQGGGCRLNCHGLILCNNPCMDQACQSSCAVKATNQARSLYKLLEDCLGQACPYGRPGEVCHAESPDANCKMCMVAAQEPGGKCINQIQACWADE